MIACTTLQRCQPGLPPDLASHEPFDQTLARLLDRQADHALHLGYRLQAERLAHRAAELREGAR